MQYGIHHFYDFLIIRVLFYISLQAKIQCLVQKMLSSSLRVSEITMVSNMSKCSKSLDFEISHLLAP